jgi:predicted enzyme related to lactoylglutathione lyase
MKNPFTWVEIYVSDMKRAQQFYEAVLKISMIPMEAPGDFGDLQMLCFPWEESGRNISGALCKTKEMQPGSGGTLVYFASDDCSVELSRVANAGGTLLQDKFPWFLWYCYGYRRQYDWVSFDEIVSELH